MSHNYPLYDYVPSYGNFSAFVDGNAARYGDRPAISYRKSPRDKTVTTVTFREFARDIHALANEAVAHGMAGVHCALIGKLSYEWVCTYVALQTIGSVVVPLDREWTGEDLATTVRTAACRYIICDSDMTAKQEIIMRENNDATLIKMGDANGEGIAEMIRVGDAYATPDIDPVDPREMSALVFTSGTTGKGKGVMLCQHGILNDARGGLRLIRAGQRSIVALPPHHTYGSNIGIIALMYAGTHLYLSCGLKYILQEMKEFQPDFMVLVPLFVETFHRRIEASINDSGKKKLVGGMKVLSGALRCIKVDLRHQFFKQILAAFGGELKFIICGGAPLRPELVRAFNAFGIDILNGYGITECSPLISVNRNKYNRIGSVGQPIPTMEVKIDHPNEKGEGEICARGDNVMLGYYQDPEETARVIDPDGYFHTGDIGRIGKDGSIYITGRIKNLIILSNGKNVYPEEIETEISGIPGVVDVVIYEGISRRGVDHNRVVAEIYPDKDYFEKNNITDMDSYFHNAVETYNRTAVQYKKIGIIKVRKEEFPKNTLRKIMRFKLDMSID